jgi:PAS domain-containing protein
VLGRFTLDFFEEPDRKRALQRIQSVYKNPTRKPKFYNYFARDFEGGRVEVEIKSVLIKFNERDCILSLVNNLNEQRQREREKIRVLITETANKQLQKEIYEREAAQHSLTEKTAHLSSILESSTHIIWTVNDNYELTSFNQNFAKAVKTNHGISIKTGVKIDEILQKNRNEYVSFWYGKYAEAFKGKKLEFIKEDNLERPLYRKIFINPIYNKNNAL